MYLTDPRALRSGKELPGSRLVGSQRPEGENSERELEDVDDLRRLRHEPTRSLADVIRELHLDGQRKDIYRRGG